MWQNITGMVLHPARIDRSRSQRGKKEHWKSNSSKVKSKYEIPYFFSVPSRCFARAVQQQSRRRSREVITLNEKNILKWMTSWKWKEWTKKDDFEGKIEWHGMQKNGRIIYHSIAHRSDRDSRHNKLIKMEFKKESVNFAGKLIQLSTRADRILPMRVW